ncbi:GntR family transcriptional regulator [Vibrio tritonius]|uniref:GntR family transcriptional regulator n=1 Tax=Vibrio tritonius TaxID=1435069 RepID=UPI0009E90C2B|nr:GntR family transcriptional regulator [Vibrio tritonius]
MMNSIKIANTKDEVSEIIKREIILGNLKANQTVTQNDIAEQFGLSRMPIREAFNELVSQGFLIKLRSRKLVVANISSLTVINYNEALCSLELSLFDNIDVPKYIDDLKLILIANDFPPKDKILRFHQYISEIIADHFIITMHYNMLNSFIIPCVKYFDFHTKSAVDELKLAVDSLGKNDMISFKNKLKKSNEIILDKLINQ